MSCYTPRGVNTIFSCSHKKVPACLPHVTIWAGTRGAMGHDAGYTHPVVTETGLATPAAATADGLQGQADF